MTAATRSLPEGVGRLTARTRASATTRPVGGAYGLRVEGVAAMPNELVDAPAHWPAVQLSVQVAPEPPFPAEYVEPGRACLQVRDGGYVKMDRRAGHARFTLSERPTASALLHPHLAAVGAVWSHWMGRDAFHAGAFVVNRGVWGVLGEKGAGKSSMLAMLARAHVPIVCDDVLVLDGTRALAGPRSIDLREDAASHLGVGEPLGIVGDRERWRIPLRPIEPELPFCGWVTLRWSELPSVRPLRGAERMHELFEHLALRVPPHNPSAVFNLGRLPFLEFSRPRRWSSIASTVDYLLDAVSG